MKWQINVKTDKKTLKKKEKEKKCHLWAKLLSMHLLEAATWIYKPQKKKLFCLRILLLEPKSGSCCKMHQKKNQQKKISPAIMMMSDSPLSPSRMQEPLSRPTTSTVSVPGRPAKPSAEANMLKWCACWTCKYDSWHPWRSMPIFLFFFFSFLHPKAQQEKC